MKRIQILLSTYNGERYLREQLDSFVTLSNFDEVKVLIRDDGSHDSTRQILEEYREKYGFELIFGENIGINASMHELVSKRDRLCEYFSFADQDDKWLPEKLARGMYMLDREGGGEPMLYASRSYLADEELNIIGKTLTPRRKLSFYNAILQNVCAGHTQIINSALAELIERGGAPQAGVFDHRVYTVSASLGRVVFDGECTTLHRQHATNAIGYENTPMRTFRRRVGRVLHTELARQYTRELSDFLKSYGDVIPERQLKEGERFIMRQRNFFTRLGYIFITKAYRNSRLEGPIFRLMYLFGKYNIGRDEYLTREDRINGK